MKCPVCQKHELVQQSLEDSGMPDTYCPEVVEMPDGKMLNHYREFSFMDRIRIILLPYRITTEYDRDKQVSRISVQSRYKSGKYYFKTLLKLPHVHTDTEEKLRDRIKTLLLFS